MEELTDKMILQCLRFIHGTGGQVSRYTFDRYVTKNIRIKESFNIVPNKLLGEGLISILRERNEVKIVLIQSGIEKITHSVT
jgi:hypothetical protein